jgi:hypothetical protein
MSGIILILPILAGKVEAWRRFCQEMSGSRRFPHEASRLQQGITRERLSLVETPFSAAAVTNFEAENVVRALSEILMSDLPFDCWYREQIHMLHGVNLLRYEQFTQHQSELENQEMLFEWTVFPGSRNGSEGSAP